MNYKYITEDVDILAASDWMFAEQVAQLEALTAEAYKTTDHKQRQEYLKRRSELAISFLQQDMPSLLSVSYEQLGNFLSNPANFPDVARWFYLLERSIPPRAGARRYTWIQRLKVFFNTAVIEQNAVGKPLAVLDGKKFYFFNKSGDHYSLHAGPGNNYADLYFFDDSISGTTFQKMQPVDVKYCAWPTIAKCIEYYKTSTHNHNAKYLLLFMENGPEAGYYLYKIATGDCKKIEELSVPKNLFQLDLNFTEDKIIEGAV